MAQSLALEGEEFCFGKEKKWGSGVSPDLFFFQQVFRM